MIKFVRKMKIKLLFLLFLLFLSINVFSSTDVNIIDPLQGAIISKIDYHIYEIGYTIISDDSNSFIIDINYSTTNSQGTGTPIISDYNTITNFDMCQENTFEDLVICGQNWTLRYRTPFAIMDIVDEGDYYILINVQGNSSDFYYSGPFEITNDYIGQGYTKEDLSPITIDFIGSILANIVPSLGIIVVLIILLICIGKLITMLEEIGFFNR